MIAKEIIQKVEKGLRLTEAEGVSLFESDDLLTLGQLAAQVNRRKHGNRIFFNVNRHINYTNVCVNRCTFCAFSKGDGEAGGYTLALEQILRRAEEAAAAGATEIHMVGGLHPDLPFSYYTDLLRMLSEKLPVLHLKAFTAVEIEYFSQISGLPIIQVVKQLREAGLGSMPGGGAEIFEKEVRDKICPEKISGERWLEIVEEIHNSGLKTNATMLFGHLETYADRIDHMARLRNLQDRTGGFQVFIPLAFQPDNTRVPGAKGVAGIDALKTLAIARLFLDNFDNIKAYWVMLGMKIAQVSLDFGVNDLDGTVVEEKIGHDAGADSPQELSRSEILRQIRSAGKVPVERDTLYREIRVYE